MKKIYEEHVVCLNCRWTGTVGDTEPDVDGEGSLGCPECNNPVEVIIHLIDELLAYRNGELEEVLEGETNVYNGEVHITNNYTVIDVEDYLRYKENLQNPTFVWKTTNE